MALTLQVLVVLGGTVLGVVTPNSANADTTTRLTERVANAVPGSTEERVMVASVPRDLGQKVPLPHITVLGTVAGPSNATIYYSPKNARDAATTYRQQLLNEGFVEWLTFDHGGFVANTPILQSFCRSGNIVGIQTGAAPDDLRITLTKSTDSSCERTSAPKRPSLPVPLLAPPEHAHVTLHESANAWGAVVSAGASSESLTSSATIRTQMRLQEVAQGYDMQMRRASWISTSHALAQYVWVSSYERHMNGQVWHATITIYATGTNAGEYSAQISADGPSNHITAAPVVLQAPAEIPTGIYDRALPPGFTLPAAPENATLVASVASARTSSMGQIVDVQALYTGQNASAAVDYVRTLTAAGWEQRSMLDYVVPGLGGFRPSLFSSGLERFCKGGEMTAIVVQKVDAKGSFVVQSAADGCVAPQIPVAPWMTGNELPRLSAPTGVTMTIGAAGAPFGSGAMLKSDETLAKLTDSFAKDFVDAGWRVESRVGSEGAATTTFTKIENGTAGQAALTLYRSATSHDVVYAFVDLTVLPPH